MSTRDRKFCLCMIKSHFVPAVFSMTFRAIGSGIILRVKETGMNILMAVAAGAANIPERPVVGFLVAGKAGRCQMRALKPENTVVVLLNGKVGFLKPVIAVAISAIGYHPHLFKIPFVVISMTVRAFAVRQRGG